MVQLRLDLNESEAALLLEAVISAEWNRKNAAIKISDGQTYNKENEELTTSEILTFILNSTEKNDKTEELFWVSLCTIAETIEIDFKKPGYLTWRFRDGSEFRLNK